MNFTFMSTDNNLLELAEDLDFNELNRIEDKFDYFLRKLGRIENKFDYFLRKKDLFYEKVIDFNVAYNPKIKKYEIKIIPAKEDFDSQKYFVQNFQSEEMQERLEEFCKENNVRFISY